MLTVVVSLVVGSERYDSQIVALRLRRGLLPVGERLEVVFPGSVQFHADPGADVELELDGGEGAARVFSGRLETVSRSPLHLRVVALGHTRALAAYRPLVSLEQVSMGDVIRRLCEDAGVEVGEVENGPTLALYASDGRGSALQEIARLARLYGTQAAFDVEGKLHVLGRDGPGEALALRYGREVLGAEVARSLLDELELTVAGEGAAEATASEGRQVIADFFRGSSPTLDANTRLRAHPELRSPSDAEAAAAAWQGRRSARATSVRLTTWLLPGLGPGIRVEVQDAPEGLPLSELFVEHAVHTVDARRGARTELWASATWATSAASPGGLL